MALFSKLFKRSFNPYELPGRWYKVTLNRLTGDILNSDIKDLVVDPSAATYITLSTSKKLYAAFLIDYEFVESASDAATLSIGILDFPVQKSGAYRINMNKTSAETFTVYLLGQ